MGLSLGLLWFLVQVPEIQSQKSWHWCPRVAAGAKLPHFSLQKEEPKSPPIHFPVLLGTLAEWMVCTLSQFTDPHTKHTSRHNPNIIIYQLHRHASVQQGRPWHSASHRWAHSFISLFSPLRHTFAVSYHVVHLRYKQSIYSKNYDLSTLPQWKQKD